MFKNIVPKVILTFALVSLVACEDPDPVPRGPIQQAAMSIFEDTQALRQELLGARQASVSRSQVIAIETVIIILSSGVRHALSNLYTDPGTALSQSARLRAVSLELDAAQSSELLALLPDSVSENVNAQIEKLRAKILETESLTKVTDTPLYIVSTSWKKLLEKEKTDQAQNREASDQVLNSISGEMQVGLTQLELAKTSYSKLVNDGLSHDSVPYYYWAALIASSIRHTVLNGVLSEWAQIAIDEGFPVPPTPLQVMNGGPGSGKSCIKASSGNEPGTSGGVASGTSAGTGSSNFPAVTPNSPPPSSGQTISPCTVSGGDTGSVPAPTPK